MLDDHGVPSIRHRHTAGRGGRMDRAASGVRARCDAERNPRCRTLGISGAAPAGALRVRGGRARRPRSTSPAGLAPSQRFERYDPLADAWEQLADLPEPRHHLSLAAVDGAVYLAGGHTESTHTATDTFWRYDPGTDAWETLDPLPQGPRGALGRRRDRRPPLRRGWVIRATSRGPATADLSRYDPAAASWELLSPMPTRAGAPGGCGGRWGGW